MAFDTLSPPIINFTLDYVMSTIAEFIIQLQ